jgi:hypothetical protein
MSDWLILAATVLNLAVAVSAAIWSRYWARRAENAATLARTCAAWAEAASMDPDELERRAQNIRATRKDTK